MSDTSSLDELMSIEYDVVIRKKGSKYTAGIEELNIGASGASVAECLAELDRKKREFFEELIEFDFADNISAPVRIAQPSPLQASSGNLWSVIRTTVLVTAIVATLSWFATPFFVDRIVGRTTSAVMAGPLRMMISGIDRIVSRTTNTILNAPFEMAVDGEKVRKRIVSTLSAAAESTGKLTPARRDQMLRDIRRIVLAVRPFADELRPLYCRPAEPS